MSSVERPQQTQPGLTRELKNSLSNFRFITQVPKSDDIVSIGHRVSTDKHGRLNIILGSDKTKLVEMLSGEKFEKLSKVLGTIISDETPVAKALIGATVGENRNYSAGGENRSMKVNSVEVSPLLTQ